MKARWLLAGIVAVGLGGVVGMADDPRVNETNSGGGATPNGNGGAGKASSPDEAAIRAVVDRFTKAFNAGDARAIARMHTPNARVIDLAGEVIEGREAIEREYTGLFHDNPGATIEIKVEDLRLIGPDAAVEEGTTRVIPKDGTPIVNRYSAVDVKRDGEWLLASVRESASEMTTHERLRELEWMLGEWVDESGDSVIQSTCRWTADKQALLREFTIRSSGKVVMTGTQRIGWDPRCQADQVVGVRLRGRPWRGPLGSAGEPVGRQGDRRPARRPDRYGDAYHHPARRVHLPLADDRTHGRQRGDSRCRRVRHGPPGPRFQGQITRTSPLQQPMRNDHE